MMENFFDGFLNFLFWFGLAYVGTNLIFSFIGYYFDRKLLQMQEAISEFRKNNLACRVEQHGDIFYIYDVSTGDFVAQGTTVEEIKTHVEKTRYRDLRIYVTEGEENVIDALKRTSANLETGHA